MDLKVKKLREILLDLGLDLSDLKLSDGLLGVKFLDCFNKYERKGDKIILTSDGDEKDNMKIIILLDKKNIELYEKIGGVERVRTFDKTGFDLNSAIQI